MKFLIVYGTVEGQTRKIARFMEDVLTKAGHTVTIADSTDKPPDPSGFDSVLIGSSIHMHKYQSAIIHYVTRYNDLLNSMPSAFFSVCLAVTSEDEQEHREADKIMQDFFIQTGWKPTRTKQIAGALLYTQYDFFKRLIMKMISKQKGHVTDTSKDYEYTDWEDVKEFAQEFSTVASRKDAGVMVNG